MIITCCHNCTPPERYPGCGDHCDEYQKQKLIREQTKKPPVVAEYIAEAKLRYLSRHVRNPYKVRT